MASPVISLQDVHIFQGQSLILESVNFEVQGGEFVYLIGKTGAGKSSLLKTLYGDLYLREGRGEVVGFDLKKLSWKTVPQLRRHLGIVFQDFRLLSDRNVYENLEFVLRATGWKDKQRIRERIEHLLGRVGLKNKGFKMPHEMSGGEQQRVDIARALLNKPSLILADEPTGNLDPETREEIMDLLLTICRDYKTAFIMATHDYSLIQKYPARVLRVGQGRVEEVSSQIW